ncbi:hypothetical protein AVEN_204902-1 [Araneus ventricosus]|uniref:Secreted protein n=1 Tax=Araneus ventricosus TaxID=182803 RepID=A0A4Y2P1Z2_ARAVE|nr:hypothetical protein AVEN_204902-1 [Araneus ventricosus]
MFSRPRKSALHRAPLLFVPALAVTTSATPPCNASLLSSKLTQQPLWPSAENGSHAQTSAGTKLQPQEPQKKKPRSLRALP